LTTFTETYNLIKPDEADYYDIADFNENMDGIDTAMAETAAEVAGVSEKIGTAADTGAETLFGKLNQMGSGTKTGLTAIKSIQHIPADDDGTYNIETVVPENCLVLFNRLRDSSNTGCGRVEWTLTATTLKVSYASMTGGEFWVIEFC